MHIHVSNTSTQKYPNTMFNHARLKFYLFKSIFQRNYTTSQQLLQTCQICVHLLRQNLSTDYGEFFHKFLRIKQTSTLGCFADLFA